MTTLPRKSAARISRRSALKAGATLAAAGAAGGTGFAGAAAADVHRFDSQPAVDRANRTLIKGGTIVSMDAKVGDLAKGDILIEGTKISAIAPNIDAARRAGDRRRRLHRGPGPGRLPPPFLGRPAAPHQSRIRRRSPTI